MKTKCPANFKVEKPKIKPEQLINHLASQLQLLGLSSPLFGVTTEISDSEIVIGLYNHPFHTRIYFNKKGTLTKIKTWI